VALDDRYANKFAPLDSTAIYPKSGHALLYTTFDRWNEMPYKSYLCLAHSISSSQMLMPHKHQTPSSLLIIIMSQHLAWSFLNDMIHSISSHDLFGPSILTLLALHRCLGPSAPNLAQASPPRGPSLQSLDLPFSIATGPSSQALSWSSPLWSHNSMSCLICNELLDHTIWA